jgi:hypothetical protein
MRSKILGLLAVWLLAGPMSAQAVVISISGQGTDVDGLWDVTTVSGASLPSGYESQAWWGNSGVASIFASTLGDMLGYPNTAAVTGSYNYAPFFVYSASVVNFFAMGVADIQTSPINVGRNLDGRIWTYAVASRVAVPEPGTLALLGLGLAGLGFARRRKAN